MSKIKILRKYLRDVNIISLFLLHNNNTISLLNMNNEIRMFPTVGTGFLSLACTVLHFIGYSPLLIIIFQRLGMHYLDVVFLYVYAFILLLFVNDRLFPSSYLNKLYEKSYNLKVFKLGKILVKLVLFYVVIPAILLVIVISFW